MSISNCVTDKLNRLEAFTENSPAYFFPLKLIAWLVLVLALIVTNVLALSRWPFSAISKWVRRDRSSPRQILEISSQEELRALASKHDKVLVDFWAEWCGPCLLMNSAIETIASQYSGELMVAKVDVSLSSNLSKSYGVRGLPTVILFKDGAELKRSSGAMTISQLSSLIEEAKG